MPYVQPCKLSGIISLRVKRLWPWTDGHGETVWVPKGRMNPINKQINSNRFFLKRHYSPAMKGGWVSDLVILGIVLVFVQLGSCYSNLFSYFDGIKCTIHWHCNLNSRYNIIRHKTRSFECTLQGERCMLHWMKYWNFAACVNSTTILHHAIIFMLISFGLRPISTCPGVGEGGLRTCYRGCLWHLSRCYSFVLRVGNITCLYD